MSQELSSEWCRGEYLISTDAARLDLPFIHDFLTHSYWANGRSIEVVKRSVENSLSFGLYRESQQIGFGRVITDYATFAYLADVFVVEAFRGKGLGQWLLQVVIAHPELQGLRKWMLGTIDAHGFYRKFQFSQVRHPERLMERWPLGEV
ncbi:GNAT family N-acetyltransferase [Leptolyngbya sp. FACHB-261]|uniref:GNAT family N-acetyltransferase n=1 Tax=Leptolyngbya sp. FACHB-261 TaxID=2692806 RepID=UPI00168367DC|nr:GNAT family N-acetyltransferase [Leptolyngbya sp. FACHB-261]MBD2103807.1 GNAT family N-acetyltransferase [Leptolyngbya sp. FACHB-261]